MNFELEQHYKNIHENGLKLVKNKGYFIDKDIHNPKDLRRGITLPARPNHQTSVNISKFLQQLKEIEPQQYFYPKQDLHITIMSILSCYPAFSLDKIDIENYIKIIKKSISKFNNFSIHFKGISLNPSRILVKGYPKSTTLNDLRNDLRKNFKKTDLEQSLDQRYAIKTAHSTILRFENHLQNSKKFLDIIEYHQNIDFGTFEVKNLELVFNDWYQKAEYTDSENFKL